MTRACRIALAVLVGTCWGAAAALAQGTAPPTSASYPAQYVGEPVMGMESPYRTPIPFQGLEGWSPGIMGQSAPADPTPFLSNAFARIEYMSWNVKDPGNVLLGETLVNVAEPRNPFVVFTPGTNSPAAVVRVLDLHTINERAFHGGKVTVGFDLFDEGTLEFSGFMTEKVQNGYFRNDLDTELIPDPNGLLILVPEAFGTSVRTNGQTGSQVFLYNESFQVVYQTQLWGGEANYYFDDDIGGFLQIRRVVGARYINISEKLTQIGIFQDLAPVPPVRTIIESGTVNNLWGPQLGVRGELVGRWLRLGLEPKLLFFGNTMLAEVTTTNLRSNNDGVFKTDDVTTSFSFGVDVMTWAKVRLNDHFSLRAGYNITWISRVTRPEDNIFYNDNGAANPPAVVTRLTKHDWFMHGALFGGEVRW